MIKRIFKYILNSIKVLLILCICLLTVGGFFNISNTTMYNTVDFNPLIYNHIVLNKEDASASDKEVLQMLPNEIIVNKEVEDFIKDNNYIIDHYALAFQFDGDIIRNEILVNNQNQETFNSRNVLNSLKEYDSFDLELHDYVSNLMSTNPDLFGNELTLKEYDKDYIIKLVDYYGQFFPLVDTSIAKAIIHIESGFIAPSMVSKNNLFGMLSSGKLIPYKTIEYGVYNYLRYLSTGYFEHGLSTIETIGYKYNPIMEGDVKIANPNWVSKMYGAIDNYQIKSTITFNELIN